MPETMTVEFIYICVCVERERRYIYIDIYMVELDLITQATACKFNFLFNNTLPRKSAQVLKQERGLPLSAGKRIAI